jgi:hypothetical protein
VRVPVAAAESFVLATDSAKCNRFPGKYFPAKPEVLWLVAPQSGLYKKGACIKKACIKKGLV